MWAFSSCDEQGYSLVAVLRILTAGASLLQSTGSMHTRIGSCSKWAQQFQFMGSRVRAQQLSCMALAIE